MRKSYWRSSDYPLVTGGGSLAAELYDPSTGTWSFAGDMHNGVQQHASITLKNGNVLVAGGLAGTTCVNTAEILDPSTLNWTSIVSMHRPRFLPTAATLKDGRTLIAGGNYENTAEFFYY